MAGVQKNQWKDLGMAMGRKKKKDETAKEATGLNEDAAHDR